jgi:Flp pilus assembly protein TadD
LELQPNFAPAHIGLANLLSLEGKKTEALTHYQEAARESPDNETAHYELARALRSAGRIEDANVEMKVFLKLKQAHASANRIADAPGDNKAQ